MIENSYDLEDLREDQSQAPELPAIVEIPGSTFGTIVLTMKEEQVDSILDQIGVEYVKYYFGLEEVK